MLLFDREDRLLLFFDRDPAAPGRPGWWYPPGGAIETGESPEEAARRELIEEVGIRPGELGPVVLHGSVSFSYGGRHIQQDEWHLKARVDRPIVRIGAQPGAEEAAIAAHRWWTPDDLARSDELFYPTGLAAFVSRLLRDGPPPTPWPLRESQTPGGSEREAP